MQHPDYKKRDTHKTHFIRVIWKSMTEQENNGILGAPQGYKKPHVCMRNYGPKLPS